MKCDWRLANWRGDSKYCGKKEFVEDGEKGSVRVLGGDQKSTAARMPRRQGRHSTELVVARDLLIGSGDTCGVAESG